MCIYKHELTCISYTSPQFCTLLYIIEDRDSWNNSLPELTARLVIQPIQTVAENVSIWGGGNTVKLIKSKRVFFTVA